MSPEQFSSAGSCDQRSDIYSFGILLYQMAVGGALPFSAALPPDDSQENAWQYWNEMARLQSSAAAPNTSSSWDPVIQRCLRKNAAERYATFAELLTALS